MELKASSNNNQAETTPALAQVPSRPPAGSRPRGRPRKGGLLAGSAPKLEKRKRETAESSASENANKKTKVWKEGEAIPGVSVPPSPELRTPDLSSEAVGSITVELPAQDLVLEKNQGAKVVGLGQTRQKRKYTKRKQSNVVAAANPGNEAEIAMAVDKVKENQQQDGPGGNSKSTQAQAAQNKQEKPKEDEEDEDWVQIKWPDKRWPLVTAHFKDHTGETVTMKPHALSLKDVYNKDEIIEQCKKMRKSIMLQKWSEEFRCIGPVPYSEIRLVPEEEWDKVDWVADGHQPAEWYASGRADEPREEDIIHCMENLFGHDFNMRHYLDQGSTIMRDINMFHEEKIFRGVSSEVSWE